MNKIAYIFPGQGSQYIGMGKDFYDNFRESRDVFDEASSILGIDMKELIFKQNDRLNITEFTQIALVTTCIAQASVVRNMGFIPDVCAGLSLGEYPALITSGVMSFQDALRVVRKRGIYMDSALPQGISSMAAVIGLSGDDVLRVCNDTNGIVTVANYNCPGQVVISGENQAVDEASKRLKDIGAKRIIKLNVSGAFHSPMLKEAGEKLLDTLESISVNRPTIPYVSNVTAEYVYDNKDIKELLCQQVYSSVKWQQSIENIINEGVNIFIEIGPGKTLSSFVKKINPTCIVLNVDKIEDLDKLQEVMHA
ncbi:MAG: ACP S-malonyltransferase [Clostridiales bacterium]|nr:ACP S-malonyltransferase [Clostridiales bacterium]